MYALCTVGDGMTHRIDIRLPDGLYKELRKHDGSLTQNVCTALTQYLHSNNNDNSSYTQHLINEVDYLRSLHSEVMLRLTALPEHAPEPKIVDIAQGPLNKPLRRSLWSRLRFS